MVLWTIPQYLLYSVTGGLQFVVSLPGMFCPAFWPLPCPFSLPEILSASITALTCAGPPALSLLLLGKFPNALKGPVRNVSPVLQWSLPPPTSPQIALLSVALEMPFYLCPFLLIRSLFAKYPQTLWPRNLFALIVSFHTWVRRNCIKLESLWVHNNSPVPPSGQPRALDSPLQGGGSLKCLEKTFTHWPNNAQLFPEARPVLEPLHFHFSRHLAACERSVKMIIVFLFFWSLNISFRKTMYNMGRLCLQTRL